MFPLPLIAYEFARRILESEKPKETAALPPEEREATQNRNPVKDLMLLGLQAPLLTASRPLAAWFADVVEANVEFAKMMRMDPVGTLRDFADFLFGGGSGSPKGPVDCLPYLLLDSMTFPPLFYFGAASFLATPDIFENRCEASSQDLQRVGEEAAQILIGAALPLIGFGGARILSRAAAHAARKATAQPQEEEFVERAVQFLTDPIGSVLGL